MRPETAKKLGIALIVIGANVLVGGAFMVLLSEWMRPWIGGLGAVPYVFIAAGLACVALGVWLVTKRAARSN